MENIHDSSCVRPLDLEFESIEFIVENCLNKAFSDIDNIICEIADRINKENLAKRLLFCLSILLERRKNNDVFFN